MIVNMNQLRSFYTAAKLNSVAKAAQMLMVTPPAITNHIKRFEEKIGIRLLVRDGNSIRLTSTGQGVLQRAEHIFQEIHEMEGYLEDVSAGRSGELRMGCPEAPLRNLVPLIEMFRETHPEVKIIFDQGSNAEMIKSIADHRNELAVIRYSPNNSKLKTKVLWQEEIVLIASPKSVHWPGSKISVTNLSQIPLVLRNQGSAVREVVLEYLRTFKINPLIAMESASTALLKEFVRHDSGLGFVQRGVAEGELKEGTLRQVRIVEGSPIIESGIAYADRRELSPAAWALLRLIDKSWPLKSLLK
jgi:LysR family transcriptional regulator, transcriptional activator of the cysJI operon